MEFDQILDLTHNAVKVGLMISSPMLLGALTVGILISIYQAVTQINEQTLTFIPKILVIVASLVIFAPWMSDTLTTFTRELIINIPNMVNGR